MIPPNQYSVKHRVASSCKYEREEGLLPTNHTQLLSRDETWPSLHGRGIFPDRNKLQWRSESEKNVP